MKIESAPQYLPPAQCTKWLQDRNIVESPYGSKKSKSKYSDQYKIVKREEFASEVVEKLEPFKDALLVVTDWNFYHPDDWQYYKPHQLPFTKMAHALIFEHNPIRYKGFGLLYIQNPAEIVSHIKHCIEFGWSVYLYPDSADTTLYFWEGELMDVWSDSKTTFSNLKKLAG